jgi:dipeptidyl aminopeptidase/acylaminoacyl peptidase
MSFRRPAAWLGVVCLSSAAVATGQSRPFRFEELARVGRVGSFSLSPDDRWIAYALATPDVEANRSRSAIWLAAVSGGAPRGLTAGDVSDSAPAFSPDGSRIAFLSTREGGSQIWILDLPDGPPRRATGCPTGVDNFMWSPDGKAFVFSAAVFPDCRDAACTKQRLAQREKSPTRARVAERLLFRHWDEWKEGMRTHVWKVPVAGGEPVDLTPGDRDAPPFAIGGGEDYQVSPDGRELVYASNPDKVEALSTNTDVWTVSFDGGGKPIDRTAANKAYDGSPAYSPDGRWIAYRAQRRAGFESDRFRLMVLERATGKIRSLTESFDDWVEEFRWAPDSRSLLFVSHVEARGAIYRVGVGGGPPAEIWKGGVPHDLHISRDGSRVFFSATTLSRPAEIYVASTAVTAAPQGGPERWTAVTHVNDELLAQTAVGSVSERWTNSADGRRLQAWVVQPPGFDPSKKYPAVFLIHGGPQGAWSDSWSFRWNPQVFAAYGYVVYAPNPRGSTGSGQKFVDDISGDWGGKVYDDLMRQADDLASLPYVDRSRIGAAGASFGGYMVDWIAGHTDRFAALVSHDGVFETASSALETEELWFPTWEFGGWPWKSPLYAKWNPMLFAENFKTPTLVVTSEKDFRVPFGQGLQFFTALQVRGVPSKILMFPDEGHWILKPGNSRLWHATVMDWLHRYLGGAEPDPRALETAYSVTR